MKENIPPGLKEDFDLFGNFRYNITVLMASNGFSSKDLSIELGFSPDRIGNLIFAKTKHVPRVEELTAIAKYFNTSMDNLIHNKVIVKFIGQ